jgi:hypothetical protein
MSLRHHRHHRHHHGWRRRRWKQRAGSAVCEFGVGFKGRHRHCTGRSELCLSLSCQHSFCSTSVSFIGGFPVFLLLEGILNDDLAIAQVLIVHAFDGHVGCFEGVEVAKAKAFALIGRFVAHNLGWPDERPEGRKGIVQQRFVHIVGVQISNEQVGPHVSGLLRLVVEG